MVHHLSVADLARSAAFDVSSREVVDRFRHATFVIDPDGYRIEAVINNTP